MAFFDELGKKISETSQGVVQKTKDTAETLKLGGMISEEEKKINDYMLQLGKCYYDFKGSDPDPQLAEFVAAIDHSKQLIDEYNEQIKRLKGIVRCEACGSEIAYDAVFCSACGTNRGPAQPQPNPSAFCTKCGTALAAGSVFCTNCGNKVAQAPAQPVEEPVAPVVPEKRFCTNCGKELTAGAKFCTGCGSVAQ